MKTVVFASVHDAARSKMAAAFFNAFTMPSLVRAVSGGTRPLLWAAPEIVQVMNEVGLDVSGRPQVLLCGVAKDIAQAQRVGDILISLSHCRAYATAYALAVRGTPTL